MEGGGEWGDYYRSPEIGGSGGNRSPSPSSRSRSRSDVPLVTSTPRFPTGAFGPCDLSTRSTPSHTHLYQTPGTALLVECSPDGARCVRDAIVNRRKDEPPAGRSGRKRRKRGGVGWHSMPTAFTPHVTRRLSSRARTCRSPSVEDRPSEKNLRHLCRHHRTDSRGVVAAETLPPSQVGIQHTRTHSQLHKNTTP